MRSRRCVTYNGGGREWTPTSLLEAAKPFLDPHFTNAAVERKSLARATVPLTVEPSSGPVILGSSSADACGAAVLAGDQHATY